jgi:hypothetical protein
MTTKWKLAMVALLLVVGLALSPATTLVAAGSTGVAGAQLSAGSGSLGTVMDGGACYLVYPDWICCPQPDGTVICRRPLP